MIKITKTKNKRFQKIIMDKLFIKDIMTASASNSILNGKSFESSPLEGNKP